MESEIQAANRMAIWLGAGCFDIADFRLTVSVTLDDKRFFCF
jgi:hypothetical protein